MRFEKSVVALAAALGLAAGMAGIARAEVSGQLVVGGKATKITHGYAYATKGFFHPEKQDVVLVLCSAEVPPAAVRDSMARNDLARAGKLACIEQTINTEKQVINFKVQHQSFKVPEGGASTEQVFDAKTFDGKTIAGRSHTKEAQKSFDDIPYSYDVTFSLPIAPLK